MLETRDISRYNITRYCTQHYDFKGKASVRLRTNEKHPQLALTSELWMSFMSFLEKSDHDTLGTQFYDLSFVEHNK